MLRLNPTQIKLDKKDIDWHVSRHDQRQATLRTTVPPKDAGKATKNDTPKKHRHGRFPDESPRPRVPLSSMRASQGGPDTEIFSDDPVPRGSRAFWDRVLAEAGTPTRVQTASMATPTVVQPSDDFLNSTHSSKGSIESASVEGHNRSGGTDSPLSAGAEGSSFLGTPYPSESSNSSKDRNANAEKDEQRPPAREVNQPSSPRNRLSFFSFRRKTRPGMDRSSDSMELGHADHSLSGSMAVDGPSDRHSTSERETSAASYGGSDSDLDDGLYGNSRDRRTISQAHSSHEDQVQDQRTQAMGEILPSPTTYPPPRAIGHSRYYSGNAPRSSLYISETAPSSSPERRPKTPTNYSPRGFESQGLLSQPPRRRKMYRARSQTYSFAESEGSPDLEVPQMDGSSTIQSLTERIPSLLVSDPPGDSETPPATQYDYQQTPTSPGRASDSYLPSSPPDFPSQSSPYSNPSALSPQETNEIRSHRSRSSTISIHNRNPSSSSYFASSPDFNSSALLTLPQRNLSPLSAGFVPHSAQRNASPQLTLPPPFSATARTVSFSNAYPPSSPASPHTPPPTRQPSSELSPSNAPSHLRIPVYNDNLDPATQPQTPVGLPRHGIPPMTTQAAAFTMPGRGFGRFTDRAAIAGWQAFGTPTRRQGARVGAPGWTQLGERNLDQENAEALTEEDRREMREGRMGG